MKFFWIIGVAALLASCASDRVAPSKIVPSISAPPKTESPIPKLGDGQKRVGEAIAQNRVLSESLPRTKEDAHKALRSAQEVRASFDQVVAQHCENAEDIAKLRDDLNKLIFKNADIGVALVRQEKLNKAIQVELEEARDLFHDAEQRAQAAEQEKKILRVALARANSNIEVLAGQAQQLADQNVAISNKLQKLSASYSEALRWKMAVIIGLIAVFVCVVGYLIFKGYTKSVLHFLI
jgi:chromosome segregation ATPase